MTSHELSEAIAACRTGPAPELLHLPTGLEDMILTGAGLLSTAPPDAVRVFVARNNHQSQRFLQMASTSRQDLDLNMDHADALASAAIDTSEFAKLIHDATKPEAGAEDVPMAEG